MSMPDDEDDRPPPVPWGDYATVILAAIFSLTGLYLIFGPSPFAGVKVAPNSAPPPAQNQEVTIGIGKGQTIHPKPQRFVPPQDPDIATVPKPH